MHISRLIPAVVSLVLALLPGGCVTERVEGGNAGGRKVKVSSSQQPKVRQSVSGFGEPSGGNVSAGATAVADGRAELDSITAADPCGNRMHAVAGALLFYYAVHRTLPATLDELRASADTGEPLEFTCPVSGHPYVYDPSGLVLRGREDRLVLYDAEPSHNGARWGVVAAPPRGMRPPTASALPLPEDLFRRYAAPPSAAPPPPVQPPAPAGAPEN